MALVVDPPVHGDVGPAHLNSAVNRSHPLRMERQPMEAPLKPGDRNLGAEIIKLLTERAAGGKVSGSLAEADPLRFTYADMEVKAYLRHHYDGVMVRLGGTKLLMLEAVPTVVLATEENLRIILENSRRYPFVTVGIPRGEVFGNLFCRIVIFATISANCVNEAQLTLVLRSMTSQYHHLPLELGQPELDRMLSKPEVHSETPADAPEVRLAPIDEGLLAESLRKLDNLVGLREVKDQINGLVALARYRRAQEAQDLTPPPFSPHMVFRGNPGTAKTSVARIIGDIYKALGLLRKGDVKVVTRGDLVGEFLGKTAPRTRRACDEARDSILFIDEAYSLTCDRDEFGLEAIQTLLVEMENNRGQLAVVVAGYPDEMDDFLRANPGLRSRFDITINFPDYTERELIEILFSMASAQSYEFSSDARELIEVIITDIPRDRNFGNGREARRWLEAIVQEQARIWHQSGGTDQAALSVISRAAVEAGLARFVVKKVKASTKTIGFARAQ